MTKASPLEHNRTTLQMSRKSAVVARGSFGSCSVISKSLKSLLERSGRLPHVKSSLIIGCVVALGVPLISILLGGTLNCLIDARHDTLESQTIAFSAFLPDVSRLLPAEYSPLAKVSVLLGLVFATVVLTSTLLYVFYRQILAAGVEFEVAMIERLRLHAKRLATSRTLSAQQLALTDSLNYHLPRVRSVLTRYWRTFPRHIVQLALCALVTFSLEPLLALLTAIAVGLVILIYRWLERLGRSGLPVVRERAELQRGALIDLSLNGPLLESVHETHEIERRFSEQLAHYLKDAARSLRGAAWKTPLVVLIAGALVCLFLFVIAVDVLMPESRFSIAGAVTFLLVFVGGAISAVRIYRTQRELRTVETAAEELERFLSLPVEEFDSESLKPIDRIRQQAELDHVTVLDSDGRKLLENVSAVFKPGQLIGVVASQQLQANTLVELLMGFGRPASGRMLVDGIDVTDLQPASLTRCAHWIAKDGAIITGSVRDNLLGGADRRNDVEISDVVKAARLTEIVQQLPDGMATIVTPGDDRITGDAAFRMGVARAKLRHASMCVIEEPTARYDHSTEQQTLEAVSELVGPEAITVILPQRLQTLRKCDWIIMLSEHKIIDAGNHADLLHRSELYRHLNYLRHNPFRSMPS